MRKLGLTKESLETKTREQLLQIGKELTNFTLDSWSDKKLREQCLIIDSVGLDPIPMPNTKKRISKSMALSICKDWTRAAKQAEKISLSTEAPNEKALWKEIMFARLAAASLAEHLTRD
jgi:hypothetical protein